MILIIRPKESASVVSHEVVLHNKIGDVFTTLELEIKHSIAINNLMSA